MPAMGIHYRANPLPGMVSLAPFHKGKTMQTSNAPQRQVIEAIRRHPALTVSLAALPRIGTKAWVVLPNGQTRTLPLAYRELRQ